MAVDPNRGWGPKFYCYLLKPFKKNKSAVISSTSMVLDFHFIEHKMWNTLILKSALHRIGIINTHLNIQL